MKRMITPLMVLFLTILFISNLSAYTITVTNGTASPATAEAGEEVTIRANKNTLPFEGWDGSDADLQLLEDPKKTSQIFTMPARDVSFSAVLKTSAFPISVTGGTASQTHARMGEMVTISANSPPNPDQVFVQWTGNLELLHDPKSETQSFSMPERNVSFTAVYDVPYTVTVTNGTASPATAKEGERVELEADKPKDYDFLRWDGSEDDLELLGSRTSEKTRFTMPARNVAFTAIYGPPPLFTIITVINGEASHATALKKENVTISALKKPGCTFWYWTASDDNLRLLKDPTKSPASFTMPGRNVAFTAVYDKYIITVTNGTASPATASKGEKVTLEADKPKNYDFLRWDGSDADLELLKDLTDVKPQSFTMPARDVSFTAVYDVPHTVTVTNGTASPATAKEGERVDLHADKPKDNDYDFLRWDGSEDDLELLSSRTSEKPRFTMPARDVAFTAIYGPSPLFTITVINGEASHATASERKLITIRAPEKQGYAFLYWTGSDYDLELLRDSTSSSQSFRMPARNVSFTATYKELNWDNGTGEKDTPYEIWTRADLELLAVKVNAGNAYRDSFFKLMDNIDLEGKANPWTPIGTDYFNAFSGTFDGAGHVISNVYISDVQYSGLFGYARSSNITNLGVENVEIYSSKGFAGGLIGHNNDYGKVSNCYATGTISMDVTTENTANSAGGLIGSNAGAINKCYAAVTVSIKAPDSRAGGLIGSNSHQAGKVSDCYATGDVNAVSTRGTNSGGLIGFIV